MPSRIEIALKDGVRDSRGERIKREIGHFLHLPVSSVRTIDVFTVDAELTRTELEAAASGPFCDPVIQAWSIDLPQAIGFDWAVEVGFRPGVTDNVGRTAGEAVSYLIQRPLGDSEAVYASVQYLLSGQLNREQVETIATGLLCNTLIQRYSILSAADFCGQNEGFPHHRPQGDRRDQRPGAGD